MLRCLTVWFVLLCMTFVAHAGQYNEVLSIGDKAPAWENLPGTDGQMHSWAELKDKEIVVLTFTCLSCPTAVDYEDRINELAKRHSGTSGRAAVVAVCVNQVAPDRLPKLTAKAKEKGFAFQYLYDESQKIAKDYGAIFTPEFYVLDRDRKVIYMGALDDSTDPAAVKHKYVEDAITAALKGEKPAVTETLARGCRVRYARERK